MFFFLLFYYFFTWFLLFIKSHCCITTLHRYTTCTETISNTPHRPSHTHTLRMWSRFDTAYMAEAWRFLATSGFLQGFGPGSLTWPGWPHGPVSDLRPRWGLQHLCNGFSWSTLSTTLCLSVIMGFSIPITPYPSDQTSTSTCLQPQGPPSARRRGRVKAKKISIDLQIKNLIEFLKLFDVFQSQKSSYYDLCCPEILLKRQQPVKIARGHEPNFHELDCEWS